MPYRIVFLLCLITLSPLCAMQKFQDYLQQRQWKKQAPAFLKAASEGNLPVLKSMLTNGIDVNIAKAEIFGFSALIAASSALERATDRRQSDAIRLLVDRGAHVNQVDNLGFSAIDYVLYSWDKDSLCFLLKNSRYMHPFKKNRCPQEILEYQKNHHSGKAAFLAESMERVAHGESRTIAEMALVGQGLPSVVTNTVLPYIGHKETQKEQEQTVQWLHELREPERVRASESRAIAVILESNGLLPVINDTVLSYYRLK